MRYPSSQCDYRATLTGHLKSRVESKHEGVRYPCPQCEYVVTTTSNLKSHNKCKH